MLLFLTPTCRNRNNVLLACEDHPQGSFPLSVCRKRLFQYQTAVCRALTTDRVLEFSEESALTTDRVLQFLEELAFTTDGTHKVLGGDGTHIFR